MCLLRIVKFQDIEPENAALLPTLDNGVEIQPPLKVYAPAKGGSMDIFIMSIVMGLHFFLECVSYCLEELFEDVVDHIADTAWLALR